MKGIADLVFSRNADRQRPEGSAPSPCVFSGLMCSENYRGAWERSRKKKKTTQEAAASRWEVTPNWTRGGAAEERLNSGRTVKVGTTVFADALPADGRERSQRSVQSR